MLTTLALAVLAAQSPASLRAITFGHLGTLVVPDGCTHVAREGIDSQVGDVLCDAERVRIKYDIGVASPGAKHQPEPRGWCTALPESDRQPLRVLELKVSAARSLFVCELPAYYSDPALLVAVPAPTVSFYTPVKTPADATWLLTVALAFRAPGARTR